MIKKVIFWIGLLLLIVDLATYYSQIKLYFTTLGVVLLAISLILLIISGFMKERM